MRTAVSEREQGLRTMNNPLAAKTIRPFFLVRSASLSLSLTALELFYHEILGALVFMGINTEKGFHVPILPFFVIGIRMDRSPTQDFFQHLV